MKSSKSIEINVSMMPSKIQPDQNSIAKVLRFAHPKHKHNNLIVIARKKWLEFNNIPLPKELELPNLCLTIRQGILIRAFYDEKLSHIIKKQRYKIQVLN